MAHQRAAEKTEAKPDGGISVISGAGKDTMKLLEALEIVQEQKRPGGNPFRVFLACGFTPLHLQTLLAAHLQRAFPDRPIELQTGIYGDLLGNLERARGLALDGGAVVLEWADFDPRLGIRHLGGWGPDDLADILEGVHAQRERLQRAFERFPRDIPLAVCLPTLPLPPASFTPGWQGSSWDSRIRECALSLSAWMAQNGNVKTVNPQFLDKISRPDTRLDVKSEVLTGFPYRLAHASAVAEMLSRLIRNAGPKKGLITDLDDTLWSGILGEVGIEGISWDLDHRSHMHGLYQNLLRALSQVGVLIGVASKNDPALVDEAFRTAKLILPPSCVFPFEVHWGAKSESVARVLQTWNVRADDVVFVDDSPMELAEVKAAHPQIQCLQFPKDDYPGCYELLQTLRNLFGRTAVSAEDRIRLESIRSARAFWEEAGPQAGASDDFLKRAGAELTLSRAKDPPDPRAFELVNKTNQFNLNGVRYTEACWKAYLKRPDTFLLLASYEDKYGPLGKVAVVAGHRAEGVLIIDVWVMSCRAFSRRIEHQCLEQLFRLFEVEEITFNFVATPRNRPIQDFLAPYLGEGPGLGLPLSRKAFEEKCPPLFQHVKELGNG